MSQRIYTKSGDTGTTGLFGGQRVGKDALRVEAYGTVDELNSVLGLARAQSEDTRLSEVDELLGQIQPLLLHLGADLATPEADGEKHGRIQIVRITATQTEQMEQAIDRLTAEIAPLTHFILPGGALPAATLHLARTVCRRAERLVVHLSRVETVNPEALRFLNRLSDLLFTMARAVNHRLEVPDVLWKGY